MVIEYSGVKPESIWELPENFPECRPYLDLLSQFIREILATCILKIFFMQVQYLILAKISWPNKHLYILSKKQQQQQN